MRTVALEEHFDLPDLSRRIDPAVLRQAGYPSADATPAIVHAATPTVCSSCDPEKGPAPSISRGSTSYQ